jgi:hypothetical protein
LGPTLYYIHHQATNCSVLLLLHSYAYLFMEGIA